MFDPTPLDRVRPRAPKGLIAFSLSLALLLAAQAASAETLVGPPAPPEVPVADRFVSPVGDPADFAQPAPGESHGYAITRGLQRSHDRHMGLDLSNRSQGGEVRAPADGVVIESRRYGGWGQLVVIAHRLSSGECVMSLLAHLKPGSVRVKPGDRVEAGQPLASVGRSGRASGPHLHFELRELGHADPWRTLWERSPVLDPLRLLGQRLAQTVFPHPSSAIATNGAGAEYLRRLSAAKPSKKNGLGSPDAPLTRLEFYSWLDAASGRGKTTKPTWNRIRHRLAARGVTVPSGKAMESSPVSVEEANLALSRLLAADRLARVSDRNRVAASELSRRGLALPAPSLGDAAWTVGPAPALTRGDGALLVLAARSWPFSPGR